MKKQEKYREMYRQNNPKWKNSLKIYINLISQEISPQTRILDIGCGHSDFLKNICPKNELFYGIDPDSESLKRNVTVKHKTIATAENLPFKNNYFDLVISSWVFEHLDNPERALGEIHRVLKPGKSIIFLTPNRWNYVVFINRLIPNKFHGFLARKLYKRGELDTFPTKYKINSVRKIDKTMNQNGFKKDKIILNGDPTYISFNNPLFKFSCLIEKILGKKRLNSLKVHIIGKYQKV